MIEHSLAYSVIGAPETVRQGIETFIAQANLDEILITGQIFDHAARVKSFGIAADILKRLAPSQQTLVA